MRPENDLLVVNNLLYYLPPIDCKMAWNSSKKTQAASINAFPTHKKKSWSATSSLKTLQMVRNEKVNEFSMVKNTNNAYNGHVAWGVGFLKEVVKERWENREGTTCSLGIQLMSWRKLSKSCQMGILRWHLRCSSSKNVSQTVWAPALQMVFMVHLQPIGIQCKHNRSPSTDWLTGFLNRDNDWYSGEYSYDEKEGEVHGCPARAPAVRSVLQAVKTRAHTKGASATRNHAEAITIEEIQKLMNWSEMQCSNELLTMVPIETIEELKCCLEHGLMRAFMTSAFTLWTRSVCFLIIYIYNAIQINCVLFRCFELLSLQARDLEDECVRPAPYYIPHFKVHLENRKGWQKEKGYDGPRTSASDGL